jgi:hypothetical protein
MQSTVSNEALPQQRDHDNNSFFDAGLAPDALCPTPLHALSHWCSAAVGHPLTVTVSCADALQKSDVLKVPDPPSRPDSL